MDHPAGGKIRMINGRVLYVDREEVWLGRGRKLLKSEDGGRAWHKRAVLAVGEVRQVLCFHRLARRLGRAGFHHLVLTGKDSGTVLANRHVFYLIPGEYKLSGGEPVAGSRPLTLCIGKEAVYYGEYRGNPERGPVHVWAADAKEKTWRPVWWFENVRHVHGVFFDPYTGAYWMTTGDEDHESGIWMSPDEFKSLEKIAGGSQQFRAIQLLFTDKHVYFGSDAPDEKNYIYRMHREGRSVEKLAAVRGSVFHGCKVGSHLFFSTAVEPSRVNTSRYAVVWGSADGVNWRIVQRFKKDIWPMKYFQYGQVLFPAGPGDGNHLWMTPFATEYDQKTFKIPLSTLATHRS